MIESEKGDVKSKTEALKKVIIMILNGEKLPGLLMTIIRFVLPLQDHTIKKLLLVFWEIVPKTTPDGRLLHEMILVCDAYRKVSQIITVLCYFCSYKIALIDTFLAFKNEIFDVMRNCKYLLLKCVQPMAIGLGCMRWG